MNTGTYLRKNTQKEVHKESDSNPLTVNIHLISLISETFILL